MQKYLSISVKVQIISDHGLVSKEWLSELFKTALWAMFSQAVHILTKTWMFWFDVKFVPGLMESFVIGHLQQTGMVWDETSIWWQSPAISSEASVIKHNFRSIDIDFSKASYRLHDIPWKSTQSFTQILQTKIIRKQSAVILYLIFRKDFTFLVLRAGENDD